jgi:outer membrane protein insertion porin family
LNFLRTFFRFQFSRALVCLTLLLLLHSSCGKYLNNHLGNKKLLVSQSTTFTPSPASKKYVGDISAQVGSLLKPALNSKFLYVPLSRLIYTSYPTSCDSILSVEKKYRLRKLIQCKMGQAPVLYDSSVMAKNISNIQNYLVSQGFFDTRVTSKVKESRKTVAVEYYVDLRLAYHIDSFFTESPDSNLLAEVNKELKTNTLLTPKSVLTIDRLNAEKNRITNYLKANGYYRFNQSYIDYQIDTFAKNNHKGLLPPKNNKANVHLIINLPPENTSHAKYLVDSIFINTDFNPSVDLFNIVYDTFKYDNLYLLKKKGKEFSFRPKALSQQIRIRPNTLFSQPNTHSSLVSLRSLSAIRNSYIAYVLDSTSQKLKAKITITNADKMQVGADFDITGNASSNALNNGLGIGGRVNWSHNNIFKGGEILSLTGRYGFEFNSNLKPSVDLGLDLGLTFPRYIGLNFMKKLFRMNNPTSKVAIKYDYYNNTNQKILTTSYSTYMAYDWSRKNTSFQFKPIEISYINSVFDSISENTFRLQLQYKPFYSVSLFNLFIRHKFPTQNPNVSWLALSNFETSGFLLYAIDQLSSTDLALKINGSLVNYSRYVKFDFDLRHSIKLGKKSSWNSHFFLGFALPFSSDLYLPYIKKFSNGGPNSLRGWTLRSLELTNGFLPILSTYYEGDLSGQMKFEVSTELRFPILYYLEGAVFVDAGNVWNITTANSSEETHWKLTDFWKQFCVSPGLGFRFNLSYFLIRLDMGIPFMKPYKYEITPAANKPEPNVLGGFYSSEYDVRIVNAPDFLPLNQWLQNITYNFAVGYPF